MESKINEQGGNQTYGRCKAFQDMDIPTKTIKIIMPYFHIIHNPNPYHNPNLIGKYNTNSYNYSHVASFFQNLPKVLEKSVNQQIFINFIDVLSNDLCSCRKGFMSQQCLVVLTTIHTFLGIIEMVLETLKKLGA